MACLQLFEFQFRRAAALQGHI